MKKSYFLKLIFLLICSSAAAKDLYLEARGAYFYPTGDRFRESYSGSGIYGLEFDFQIYKRYLGWLETDFYTEKGYTKGDRDHMKIDIIRYSFGFKYLYDKYFIQPYIGIGPAVVWLHSHVDSPYLIRCLSQTGVGPLAKVGAFIKLPKSIFIDIYADYLWKTMDLSRSKHTEIVFHHADISGFSFGTGIGYQF